MQIDGPVILTHTGRYVSPVDLKHDDVAIEDIAHALSNQCRFSGHVRRFYSVAEHSLHVAELCVSTPFELWALLHDASEAYLVDLPRPLKYHGQFGEAYRAIEADVQRTILQAFGIRMLAMPKPVHRADIVMLATERRDLMPQVGEWALLEGVEPTRLRVVSPMQPAEAERAFLLTFERLTRRMEAAA